MKRLLNFLRGLWAKLTPEEVTEPVPEESTGPQAPMYQVPDLDVMVGKIKDTDIKGLGQTFPWPTWPKVVPQTGETTPGRNTIESPVWDSLRKLDEDFPVRTLTSVNEYSCDEVSLLEHLISDPQIIHKSTDRVMDSIFMNFETSKGIKVIVQLKNEIYASGVFAECGFISVKVQNPDLRQYWILFCSPHSIFAIKNQTGRPSIVAIANQVRKFIYDSERSEDDCIYKIAIREPEVQSPVGTKWPRTCYSRSILRTDEQPYYEGGDFLYDPKISMRCMADAGMEYVLEDGVIKESIEMSVDGVWTGH